jgi:diguanylate cyclase (GGDEF)-like protein
MRDRAAILVVDDSETNIDILVELLSDTYEVLVALDGESALEIVEEDKIDLILLDIMMPEMDGYEVCSRLKSKEETENIPIIFITARTDEEAIEKAYDAGGVDYVTKPIKPKELSARVKIQLKLQRLIRDLEKSKEELRFLASTDSLTKLYNRRFFSVHSERILNLARRDKSDLSIIMIDIDKFKGINDTHGHKVGDNAIVSLASTLKKFTRKSDLLCRFGGEEFLILLPETDIGGAIAMAEKIRKEVEKLQIDTKDGRKAKLTVSIGVAQMNGENDSIEALIHRSDKALYEAKENGRNRVHAYTGIKKHTANEY